tara:strand:- start:266 stop:544 length:279 start_codon:yes stop_codon:yes gene_type:complete
MRIKHKKFIDPRYFMDEKREKIQEVEIGGGDQTIQGLEPQFAGDLETVAAASEEIERILNQLYDSGVDNDGLKALLQNIIKDIDSGFVGEPT